MFTGLLLKESLEDESVLEPLRVTKTDVWDVENAADWRPAVGRRSRSRATTIKPMR